MSVHSSLYMGGSFLGILFLGILVERSANLAAVVLEHERCLDHVRERAHLHGRTAASHMNSSTENSGLNVSTCWRVDEAYARGVTAIGKEVSCVASRS